MKTATVSAEVLNDLVEINNDRIVGYEKALEELQEGNEDLRTLFLEMIDQSRQYRMALGQEVEVMGEEMEKGTTTSGKIYRAWMDVKAVFTGHDRKTVLENCEFGEDAAQKAYKMALDETDISAALRDMITEQKSGLKVAHDKIKALRDSE
ncbi:aldehyde dehydrogenase [Pedobacter yulinensis]|uniref:Aldehyde dehydrogenase n=1 Tax=Pedobacter yulinensis TaxID=2126353 RepID=A0A2T3HLS1_9SPHI|nr:PA2169 family four-helix-bundle protein [Pedobacter yulinensis]PST83392.1 aldehyde dehydrogenase [Pedobacter yulinensis]